MVASITRYSMNSAPDWWPARPNTNFSNWCLINLRKERGLLKAGGKQRRDSTHVLAAVRELNRTEGIAETLRAALNALALVAPSWLREQVTSEWFERYA